MASGQPFNSPAFIRSPRRSFGKLQLKLQPLYPGGDVVTLNVEVEPTGWKRQSRSVGGRKRRETTYEAAWWCAVSVFVTASMCVCLCVCDELCWARTLWSVRRCCCTQIKCVFWMRRSVGGVCVRRLIIAGCLCFASACMTACAHVGVCLTRRSSMWVVS